MNASTTPIRPAAGMAVRRVQANGQPGAVLLDPDGRLIAAMALDIAGGTVLGGVITREGSVDERNLRWHVYVWDLWFVVWGALIVVAVMRYRGRRS